MVDIRKVFAALFVWASVAFGGAAHADETLWQAVRSGEAFAIMRHAIAPGYSDPAAFDEADCATQRNLSDEGRAQARRIGDRFRENGIADAQVMTSVWCRCRDTATLLDLGPVEELRALNSFFEAREQGPAQTAALKRWLQDYDGGKPLVLVTHQVNITGLLGVGTQSGETVIARFDPDGTFEVMGSFR